VLLSISVPVELEPLRSKYEEMLEMRLAHEAGTEDPSEVRLRMAELALRFPGALREIDELELGEIRARIEALGMVLRGDVEKAEWMIAIGLFHAAMRGALSVKRWLAGRKRVDLAIEEAFAREVTGLAFAEDARAWRSELPRIAAPPRGRLSSIVYERIARQLGTSERKARRLVFREKSSSPTRPLPGR
jgi:hypothetical protein